MAHFLTRPNNKIKRATSAMVVIAMLASLIVLPAFAAPTPTTGANLAVRQDWPALRAPVVSDCWGVTLLR